MAAYQSSCERKVLDAEQRLRQHRDRTITLLAEKDSELEMVRERLPGTMQLPSSSELQVCPKGDLVF